MEIYVEFGKIVINGNEYNKDVVLTSDGTIFLRPKEVSKPKKEIYGHTPLTKEELQEILKEKYEFVVIGTGIKGYLPIEKEAIDLLKEKAKFILIGKTPNVIAKSRELKDYIAILHITC